MNALQRYGLYGAGAALACLIAAHNPTAGYTTAIARFDPWPLPAAVRPLEPTHEIACPSPTAEQRDALASQQRFLGTEIGECRLVALDLDEWRSNGALVPYLATLRKLAVFTLAILLGALSWLWLMRDPTPEELGREAPARRKPAI